MSQNRRDKRKLERNKESKIEIAKKYKALKIFFIVAIVIFVLLLFILVLYSNMYIADHTH
jgi:ABC-type antimicrobial peptide transport system permease subunit